ncbi:hypothetical protein [Mycobacterium sp.]|uniref:hypothetical protein n=1 Tax=Mycobacterium sp. TaxID=1785 RepID=UPI0031CE169B
MSVIRRALCDDAVVRLGLRALRIGRRGFCLPDVAAVAERVGLVRELCAETGRDPGELHLAVALADLREADVAAVPDWVAGSAARPGSGI